MFLLHGTYNVMCYCVHPTIKFHKNTVKGNASGPSINFCSVYFTHYKIWPYLTVAPYTRWCCFVYHRRPQKTAKVKIVI